MLKFKIVINCKFSNEKKDLINHIHSKSCPGLIFFLHFGSIKYLMQ